MARRPHRPHSSPAAALAVAGVVAALQPAVASAAVAPSTLALQARVDAVRAALRDAPVTLSAEEAWLPGGQVLPGTAGPAEATALPGPPRPPGPTGLTGLAELPGLLELPGPLAQAASWTNWPKWSKWSNWGNK